MERHERQYDSSASGSLKRVPLDITMCPGGDCPLRQRCYRYRGIPEGRQDAFGAPPYDLASGTCDSFWAIAAPDEKAIRTRAYYMWVARGRPDGSADAHWQAARTALDEEHHRLLRDDLP